MMRADVEYRGMLNLYSTTMYLKTTKMSIENQIRIEETFANPMLTITSTPKQKKFGKRPTKLKNKKVQHNKQCSRQTPVDIFFFHGHTSI